MSSDPTFGRWVRLISPAPLESQVTGLSVARMSLVEHPEADGSAIARAIEESPFDVVIIRVPASDVGFGEGLQESHLISWQADTLLYFELSGVVAANHPTSSLNRAAVADRPRVVTLVSSVFAGYANHYVSNPLLKCISVPAAYADWAVAALDRVDQRVFIWNSEDNGDAGVCVVECTGPGRAEILLAGVVPAARRQGVYVRMIREVSSTLHAEGVSKISISTQASNIGVMRAWCRLGFLPTQALNTLHVVKPHLMSPPPQLPDE